MSFLCCYCWYATFLYNINYTYVGWTKLQLAHWSIYYFYISIACNSIAKSDGKGSLFWIQRCDKLAAILFNLVCLLFRDLFYVEWDVKPPSPIRLFSVEPDVNNDVIECVTSFCALNVGFGQPNFWRYATCCPKRIVLILDDKCRKQTSNN